MNIECVYYITQERAMAPGIADGWPDVIPAPHTPNGRLVKRQGNPDKILAERDRLKEALTPSEATKYAYMGEFIFRFGEGHVNVPWTTIKEIMAKIRDRAALQEAGDAD